MRLGFFLAATFLLCTTLMVFGMGRWGQALVHGNSPGCYMRLYTGLPENVRVLVTGSSRIRRSNLSEAVIAGLGYTPDQVGDLSHPGVKLHLDYGLAEHFSHRQEIDLLLLEIRPESPSLRSAMAEDGRSYRTFGEVTIDYKAGLPIPSILRQIFSENEPVLFKMWTALNTLTERATYAAYLVLDPRRTAQVRHTIIDLREPSNGNHCVLAAWDEQTDMVQLGLPKARRQKEKNAEIYADWQDIDPLGFFEADEMAGERAVIRKVVALGKERDFVTVFLYLPEIYVPIDNAAISARFAQEFGALLLIPDSAVRAQLNFETYTDVVHPNNEGRRIIQAWLAEQLASAITHEAAQ